MRLSSLRPRRIQVIIYIQLSNKSIPSKHVMLNEMFFDEIDVTEMTIVETGAMKKIARRSQVVSVQIQNLSKSRVLNS